MTTAPTDTPTRNGTPLARTRIDTPVGTLVVVASDAGLRAVLWGDEPLSRVKAAVTGGEIVDDPSHPVLVTAVRQLEEYFAGTRRDFDVAIDPQGTDFQRSAWTALCSIPFGETVSYGEQARRMGDVRKARAVGAANGRKPDQHRRPVPPRGRRGRVTDRLRGRDGREGVAARPREVGERRGALTDDVR